MVSAAPRPAAPGRALTLAQRARLEDARAFLAESPSYLPRGTALRAFASASAEVVVSGPAGTGKSRGWLEWINFLAQRYPRCRILIVRKTRASLTESALVTFERHVLGEGHPLVTSGPTRAHRHSYTYPNGSEVVTGGLDNPTRLFSTEYDLIYVPEATELSLDEWESLLRALRNGAVPYQQLAGDCNPGPPTHWLKRRADEGGLTMLYARHEDNPRLYDEAAGSLTPEGSRYLDILDRLTGARKLRLRHGLWVAAEGAVYEGWDEGVNLLDRNTRAYGLTGDPANPIPAAWRRIRTVDFGYTNPFVCQWWAIDPDRRMFLYREIYRTRRLVEDHARDIVRLSAGERIEATVADHDAEDRATMERHGVKTIAAYKAISRGIEATAARIRPAGDGRPRLFILRDSLAHAPDAELVESGHPWNTAQEVPAYIYPPGKDGKPNKEEPLDRDNHGMDAERYGVAYVDQLQHGPPAPARRRPRTAGT